MNRIRPRNSRVLAIAPSSKGFGFAVLDGQVLVDWGVRSVVKGDKNAQCVSKVEKLILRYMPHVMVLQHYGTRDTRRSGRIRDLGGQLIVLARDHKIKAASISRERIYRAFSVERRATKHTIAEILAKRFPEELTHRLPPKRRPWMSEDYRMAIFDATALALSYMYCQRTIKTSQVWSNENQPL